MVRPTFSSTNGQGIIPASRNVQAGVGHGSVQNTPASLFCVNDFQANRVIAPDPRKLVDDID
jgi:hypothetical protein